MPKSDVNTRLSQVEQNIIDLQYGLFKTPWGPSGISNKLIKPKSVDAGIINVDDLESVNSKTGDLSVTGSITIGQQGALFTEGKTTYADTDPGLWFGYDTGSGTYRFNLGGVSNSMKWDGAALTIVGSLTATTGTIGGWTIGSTSLTSGSGASTVGLDTSGGSTPAIYAGSSTPSSAPFRVTQAGALTATNVTITGGAVAGITVDSTNGFLLGSGATSRGVSTGSTAFYAGSATPGSAPFRVSSGGALVATSATLTGDLTTSNLTATGGTIAGWSISSSTLTGGSVTIDSTNGIIRSGATSYSSGTGWILDNNSGTPRFRVGTATSGTNYISFDGTNVEIRGKLKFGSGGSNFLDSSIAHFEVTSSETAEIEFKNGSNNFWGEIRGNASSTATQVAFYTQNSGSANDFSYVTCYTDGSNSKTQLIASQAALHQGQIDVLSTASAGSIDMYTAGSVQLGITESAITARLKFYPGSGSATQSTYYIAYDATRTAIEISGTPNWTNILGSAAGASNWSGSTAATDTGGHYIKMYVGNTLFRIPVYADA